MKFLFPCFFYLGALLPAAHTQTHNLLIGTWQGKNDLGHEVRIEFSRDGYYLLSVDGAWLINNRAGAKDPIRYEVAEASSPDLRVTLFEESGHSDCGVLRIAFPNEDQLELAPLMQDDKPDLGSVILLRKLQGAGMK